MPNIERRSFGERPLRSNVETEPERVRENRGKRADLQNDSKNALASAPLGDALHDPVHDRQFMHGVSPTTGPKAPRRGFR